MQAKEQFQEKIQATSNQKEKIALENNLKKTLLEKSYLGMIGKATEPIFEPIGLNWQLTVALESGLAAKEVVVATLGVLYSLGEDIDEQSSSLLKTLKANISLPTAISFIVFVMIYLPCFAASAVFTREAGGVKYLVYLFIFTTLTAYIMSFIAYRATVLLS